jgi:hypothetical protein
MPDTQPKQGICLLVVWLGDWPVWMPMFLQSCSGNADIHWYLLADRDYCGRLPDNVRVLLTSLAEVGALASKVWSADLTPKFPYKVCDFKPSYGLMYPDIVRPYAYWGYTDLDICYGAIDRFVSAQDLLAQQCDVFTAAPRVIVGHFTLFRNCDAINRLCLAVPQAAELMQRENCEAFDEKAFAAYLTELAAAGRLKLMQGDIQLDDLHFQWQRRRMWLVLKLGRSVWDVGTWRQVAYFHFMSSKYKSGYFSHSSVAGVTVAFSESRAVVLSGWRTWLTVLWLAVLAVCFAVPWNFRRALRRLFSGS